MPKHAEAQCLYDKGYEQLGSDFWSRHQGQQKADILMDAKRLMGGFGWGVVATLAMSALMILGVVARLSPMPSPIPVAIVNKGLGLLGVGLPMLLIMLLAAVAHLSYGGVWGAVLAALTRPVTIWKGIGLGILLWFIMQIVVLPLLGWGFFGVAITPRIAVATLILHLVYGTVLGWLMDRSSSLTRK